MTSLSSALAAGLLLAALPVLKQHNLPVPAATAVLDATGVARTTAYKVKRQVEAALPGLLQPPGRPSKPPLEVDTDTRLDLAHKAREFVYGHPGCVSRSSQRSRYSQRFHLFVLELCEDADLPYEVVAEETGVPLGTLKDWMAGERPDVEPPDNLAAAPGPSTSRIESVLAARRGWDGDFKAFCAHVQFDLRIPFSRKTIDDILYSEGVRIPKKRRRSPDASVNRRGFETFFPNAQLVGDGTELVLQLLGHTIKVNLELLVDAHTGAFTGASIRPTEDAAAVTEAFSDSVNTA